MRSSLLGSGVIFRGFGVPSLRDRQPQSEMHREYLYQQSLARLSRREWLRLASILGGGAVLGAASPVDHTLARQRLSGYPFTLGVASGDPLPDSVVLWT